MGKTIKRKFIPSSGDKKSRNALRRAKVLERKVRRWDAYRERGKKVSKNKKLNRAKNWDTSGLLKQIEFLKKVS